MSLRTIGRLTQKQVSNAEPPKDTHAVLVADGGFLYLQCTLSAPTDGRFAVAGCSAIRWISSGMSWGLGLLHTIGPSVKPGTGRVIYGGKSSTASTRWTPGARPSESGWPRGPPRRRP